MRLFLSYPAEFEKGEGIHIAGVLRRMGHEVIEAFAAAKPADGSEGQTVRGYPAETTIEDLLREHGPADLFLYIEPLGLIPRSLEQSPIPTACILCDVHRQLAPRRNLARLFDHVFLYHRNYVSRFDEHPEGAVGWLPYACDLEIFKDLSLPRDIDVAFVGQMFGPGSERRRVLDEVGRRWVTNPKVRCPQKDIPSLYSRAKIVLNLPLADDLNFRFFEAMSCGALLLTRRVPNGQEELFREGTHYAAFASEQELLDKVSYFLSHEAERRGIAAEGYREVRARHSLEIRLGQLLSRVAEGPARGAPARRLAPDEVHRVYARHYSWEGRIEALLRMAARGECPWRARLESIRAMARRLLVKW